MLTGRANAWADASGRLPNAAILLDHVRKTTRPDAAALRPDAPQVVVSLMKRGWAQKPQSRPSAAEAASVLAGCLQTASAAPSSASQAIAAGSAAAAVPPAAAASPPPSPWPKPAAAASPVNLFLRASVSSAALSPQPAALGLSAPPSTAAETALLGAADPQESRAVKVVGLSGEPAPIAWPGSPHSPHDYAPSAPSETVGIMGDPAPSAPAETVGVKVASSSGEPAPIAWPVSHRRSPHDYAPSAPAETVGMGDPTPSAPAETVVVPADTDGNVHDLAQTNDLEHRVDVECIKPSDPSRMSVTEQAARQLPSRDVGIAVAVDSHRMNEAQGQLEFCMSYSGYHAWQLFPFVQHLDVVKAYVAAHKLDTSKRTPVQQSMRLTGQRSPPTASPAPRREPPSPATAQAAGVPLAPAPAPARAQPPPGAASAAPPPDAAGAPQPAALGLSSSPSTAAVTASLAAVDPQESCALPEVVVKIALSPGEPAPIAWPGSNDRSLGDSTPSAPAETVGVADPAPSVPAETVGLP